MIAKFAVGLIAIALTGPGGTTGVSDAHAAGSEIPARSQHETAANTRSKVTISAPASPRAGRRFMVRGHAFRQTAVVVQSRKPGLRRWVSLGKTESNARGVWRIRTRLTPGAWDLRVKSRGQTDRTRLLLRGHQQKVTLRKGVERVRPKQVVKVNGDPSTSQTLTLRKTSQLPQVGEIVVSNHSRAVPDGLLGRVVSVHPGTRKAVLKPASLSQAYREYRLSVVSTLGALSSNNPRASSLASLPVRLRCRNTVTGSPLPTVTTTLDMSSMKASLDMDIANRYLGLLVAGRPTLKAGVSWESAVESGCEVRVTAPSIPLGPTGLTLDIAAVIEASLQSGGVVSLDQQTTARLAVGFTAYRNQITYARGANLTISAPRLTLSQKAGVEITLKSEVALMVAGRVGIFGSFGPLIEAELSRKDVSTACLDVTGGLKVALGMKADLFVVDWRVDLAKTKITLGRVYTNCFGNAVIPGPGPTTGPTPAPSPSVPPSRTQIARSSGPAGFWTLVRGFGPCTSASPQLKAVLYLEQFGGWGAHLMPAGDDNSIDFFSINVEMDRPVGTHRFNLECRNAEDPDSWESVKAGVVVDTYAIDLTVTGPPPSLHVDRAQVSPGQTVVVTDGGGCGQFAWTELTWDLLSSDSKVHVDGHLPLAPSGRWGPLSITIPEDPVSPGGSYSLHVGCEASVDGMASGVHYSTVFIPTA